jgi:hypothetical protein
MTESTILSRAAGLIMLVTLFPGVATPGAAPQPPATPAAIEVQKLGPQVGTRVPAFSLRDQHGEMRTLSSLIGRNGAILVFFRSADW